MVSHYLPTTSTKLASEATSNLAPSRVNFRELSDQCNFVNCISPFSYL